MNISTIPSYYFSNMFYEYIIEQIQNDLDKINISDIHTKKAMDLIAKRNKYYGIYEKNRNNKYSIIFLTKYIETNDYNDRRWIADKIKEYLSTIDPWNVTLEAFENDVRNYLKVQCLLEMI